MLFLLVGRRTSFILSGYYYIFLSLFFRKHDIRVFGLKWYWVTAFGVLCFFLDDMLPRKLLFWRDR